MRPLRISVIALVAATGLVLAGCGDDDTPSADNTDTTSASTPSEDDSATPMDSATDEETSDTTEAGDVGDFPDVDGYTLVALPGAAKQAFGSAVEGTPEIEGFEGRLVEKDGAKAGLTIRIGVDASAADLPNFEDQFLPAFAGGLAGTSAQPEFEDINGVKVVKIGTPDGNGTAYAWIEGNIATVLVFQDAADAQAYAEGAIS